MCGQDHVSRGRDRGEAEGKTGGVRTWDLGQGGYEVEEHGWSRLTVDIRSDREGTDLCNGQQLLEGCL